MSGRFKRRSRGGSSASLDKAYSGSLHGTYSGSLHGNGSLHSSNHRGAAQCWPDCRLQSTVTERSCHACRACCALHELSSTILLQTWAGSQTGIAPSPAKYTQHAFSDCMKLIDVPNGCRQAVPGPAV